MLRAGPAPGARHAAGPLGRWAAGPLGRWAAGPLGRWAAGPLGRWAAGPLGRWAAGPLGRWAAGPLGRWAAGPLGLIVTPENPGDVKWIVVSRVGMPAISASQDLKRRRALFPGRGVSRCPTRRHYAEIVARFS